MKTAASAPCYAKRQPKRPFGLLPQALGVPPKTFGRSPKPVILSVGADNRLQHIISFVDESTPNSKAKPAGVLGCEIWCAIGAAAAPPADPKNYRFLALDTATPYIATFDAADGGKMVWYILRWVNPKGQTGTWSTAEGAIIRP